MHAGKPDLQRRVRALEKSLPPWLKPDARFDDEIMARAELRVSEEDREICARALFSPKPVHEVSKREWEAMVAYDSAIKLECTRAGYRSMDEFLASYCGGR
jgi:hypothetical protein